MAKEIDDLKYIKKHYGEEMMHFCRKEFFKILERPGVLSKILDDTFQHSKTLIKDIKDDYAEDSFIALIFSLSENLNKEDKKTDKTPEELMLEAGYILFPECKTEADIQKFKCYYKPGEELCTFRGGRLKSCRVWFAVKENVDEIKREDFQNPKRQDEYGTSVISIQFSRSENRTLSIKNRYNHTVPNPDNTFNSNLENINEGLTDAFDKHYGVKDKSVLDEKLEFELDNYVCYNGKFYHYNLEINNVYYCDNNTIVDFNKDELITLPNHVILAGYHIFDTKQKKVYAYDEWLDDAFERTFGKIKNISYDSKSKEIIVKVEDGEDIVVGLNERGNIKSLKNNNVTQCYNNFMQYYTEVESIELKNLERCGAHFLYKNNGLKSLDLPKLKRCGNDFLAQNARLTTLDLPSLERCGDAFLFYNRILTTLDLPNLEECGDSFMSRGSGLVSVDLPKLKRCGTSFILCGVRVTNLNMPSLERCGHEFLAHNRSLTTLDLPSLEECGADFLLHNKEIDTLRLPKLKRCGNRFLDENARLTALDLPSLEECGDDFLLNNVRIETLSLPKLKRCGNAFILCGAKVTNLNMPSLEECGNSFLSNNEEIDTLSLPKLKRCGNRFFAGSARLTTLDLPSLEECGADFLLYNKEIDTLRLPKLKRCGNRFLDENARLTTLDLPNLEECGAGFISNNCGNGLNFDLPSLRRYNGVAVNSKQDFINAYIETIINNFKVR